MRGGWGEDLLQRPQRIRAAVVRGSGARGGAKRRGKNRRVTPGCPVGAALNVAAASLRPRPAFVSHVGLQRGDA